jgi:NAD(P)-dependent dehydrogenase (short-subunit alcohol dehydrogenase family)
MESTVMSDKLRVLVTAGASGIGRAVAATFHLAGHQVFICDIDKAAVHTTLGEFGGMQGSETNVGDSDAVHSMFDQVIAQYGGLDVLVNNAGIGGPRAPLDEISDEAWQQTLDVNINGTFYCMRAAARVMKAQGNGCIVNISSASARTGLPLRAAYVTSKQAVQGLTSNCARELGPYNISCNAILPGAIDNERGHALVRSRAKEQGVSMEQAEQQRLMYISMRRRIEPSEIGETALFLATKGRHISGQMIGVCGNSEWEAP